MTNTILIQIRNEKNESKAILSVEYSSEADLLRAINLSLAGFLTHGVLTMSKNQMEGLELHGIPFQKNAGVERSLHYQKTGN